MHTIRRRKTALPGTLTIREFHNEKVRKPNLTITVTTRFGILFTEARMFTQTIDKLPDNLIGCCLSFLVNLGFQREGTEQTLFRIETQTLHNVIGTKKPILLPFSEALVTMTAGNMQTIILLLIKDTNINLILLC